MRAVVTGATGGIGAAICRQLAAKGATVVMVGRSNERLEQTRRQIGPDSDLLVERADLSLMSEVRDLADRIAKEPPDVVICNAAIIAAMDDITSEGLQRTLATNHLAPYLLLRTLADAMRHQRARFVIVGGAADALARLPVKLDDLTLASGWLPSWRPFMLYARTKNMNAMFGYSLARRLAGTSITVNGVHPGIIKDTGLGSDARGLTRLFGLLLSKRPSAPGPEIGADSPVWLATSPEVEGITGKFFYQRQQVETAPHTTDADRCEELWSRSARLVGIEP
jgi:NAD(P)-dependent dehydrogenase (short-subunit alcohol dehydrogenase family)